MYEILFKNFLIFFQLTFCSLFRNIPISQSDLCDDVRDFIDFIGPFQSSFPLYWTSDTMASTKVSKSQVNLMFFNLNFDNCLKFLASLMIQQHHLLFVMPVTTLVEISQYFFPRPVVSSRKLRWLTLKFSHSTMFTFDIRVYRMFVITKLQIL